MPVILTGSLHPSNKNAISWNEKGIIVFGCHCTLVFVDVNRLKIFQTIEVHKAAINLVSWKPESNFLTKDNFNLICASSDISGKIFIWNVLTATLISSFSNFNITAVDLQWLSWHDKNRIFLLTLHSNNILILWNTLNGNKIWEFFFTTSVFSFTLDPFDSSNLTCSSIDSTLIFVANISLTKAPDVSHISQMSLLPKTKKKKESLFVQIKYHNAYKNLIFALFNNEIFCVEVSSKQIIYNITIDSNTPLCQILPCSRRDAFFLVYFKGFISLQIAHTVFDDDKMKAKIDYKKICFNETQRISPRLKLLGSALCPITQSSIALLFNSGHLVFYQMKLADSNIEPYRLNFIENFLSLKTDLNNVYENFSLLQYGSIPSLCSTVTVCRIRSFNFKFFDSFQLNNVQLAAIATSTGNIYLINVFTGKIERNFQIHSCPIKCLEWGGNNVIISAGYSASLSLSATVRNDLFATNIRTGVKKRIRQEVDESPIELIRVSFYQCYLAISFRNEPLEIWDLNSMRLLRKMSRRCPIIVDIAWSGKHHNIKTISDTNIYRENLVVLDHENHLYHIVVKGLYVKDGKEVSTQWKTGFSKLKCIVWKDDILVFGDSAGRLGVWNLIKLECRQTELSQSTNGPILRCVFSHLTGDTTLAVQHPNCVVLWDIERMQSLQKFEHVSLSIIDMDMCGTTPVYVASDGIFRFCYIENYNKNLSVSESEIPILLQHKFVNNLKTSILDSKQLDCIDTSNFTNFQLENWNCLKKKFIKFSDFLTRLNFLFKFLGQIDLSKFCEVIIGVLMENDKKNTFVNYEKNEINYISTNLQLFWNSKIYRVREEIMTRILLSCSKTAKQLEQCIEKCIIIKKNNLAMFFLLNSNYNEPLNAADFRINALKTCLLGANLQSEESQCVVKLTATNLIASNLISDGIQLLFLIDQGYDACKYLISQGLWLKSINFSKMSLKCNFEEILLKYVNYLLDDEIAYKSLALLITSSLGKWEQCRLIIKTVKEKDIAEILNIIISEAENRHSIDVSNKK